MKNADNLKRRLEEIVEISYHSKTLFDVLACVEDWCKEIRRIVNDERLEYTAKYPSGLNLDVYRIDTNLGFCEIPKMNPYFFVNKLVWTDEYRKEIEKVLSETSVYLIVDSMIHGKQKNVMLCFTCVADFRNNLEFIEKLINGVSPEEK